MESAPFFTPDSMVLSVWALPQLDFCILRVKKTARLLNQRSVLRKGSWEFRGWSTNPFGSVEGAPRRLFRCGRPRCGLPRWGLLEGSPRRIPLGPWGFLMLEFKQLDPNQPKPRPQVDQNQRKSYEIHASHLIDLGSG